MNRDMFFKDYVKRGSFTHLIDFSCPKCSEIEMMACRDKKEGFAIAICCTKDRCNFIAHTNWDLNRLFEENGR